MYYLKNCTLEKKQHFLGAASLPAKSLDHRSKKSINEPSESPMNRNQSPGARILRGILIYLSRDHKGRHQSIKSIIANVGFSKTVCGQFDSFLSLWKSQYFMKRINRINFSWDWHEIDGMSGASAIKRTNLILRWGSGEISWNSWILCILRWCMSLGHFPFHLKRTSATLNV